MARWAKLHPGVQLSHASSKAGCGKAACVIAALLFNAFMDFVLKQARAHMQSDHAQSMWVQVFVDGLHANADRPLSPVHHATETVRGYMLYTVAPPTNSGVTVHELL